MRALRKFGSLLAACIAAAAALAQPAAAADLRNDPLIRDALNRANFEPGGKYHLFGSRGTVAERTGQMTISPTVTQQIGNLQIRQATIFSNPGYIVRFSGHGHEVHAPFDNSASRSASVKQGSVLDGFTMYQMSWDGYEHHPADGYDGPQGGGYPAPQGARDIYAYVVKGKAQSIKLNPTDTRSTEQRFADRFGNIPKNFSDRANEANKKMFDRNPNLDRWGNAMEFINGVAPGAVNPFIGAGEALGVNDAVQGVGFGIDLATMAAISPMSAEAAMSTVGGLGRLAEAEKGIGNAVRDWTAENPNAAETVEAALNAAAAAKAAKLAKTGTGKAAVSEDFADNIETRTYSSTPQVIANGVINGKSFKDVNQSAKIGSPNTPTLIADRVNSKIQSDGKPRPNATIADSHAEIGVIQKAYDSGKTQGASMTMTVSGKDVCGYCKGDIAAAAQKSGLKSLTIKATDYETGKTTNYFWQPGMKSIKEQK